MKKRRRSIPKIRKLKPFPCCPICGKQRRNGFYYACSDCRRGTWNFVEIGSVMFTWWFDYPNVHVHADTQSMDHRFITRDRLINFHDLVYSRPPAKETLMETFQEIHDEIVRENPNILPMLM